MSAYTRAPLGFKAKLAGISDRPKPLKMGRLARELSESLTPLQRVVLSAALLRVGQGLPAIFSQDEKAGLSISQRNALLSLAVCNDLNDLIAYFKGSL
jgi:hypothetical protein